MPGGSRVPPASIIPSAAGASAAAATGAIQFSCTVGSTPTTSSPRHAEPAFRTRALEQLARRPARHGHAWRRLRHAASPSIAYICTTTSFFVVRAVVKASTLATPMRRRVRAIYAFRADINGGAATPRRRAWRTISAAGRDRSERRSGVQLKHLGLGTRPAVGTSCGGATFLAWGIAFRAQDELKVIAWHGEARDRIHGRGGAWLESVLPAWVVALCARRGRGEHDRRASLRLPACAGFPLLSGGFDRCVDRDSICRFS